MHAKVWQQQRKEVIKKHIAIQLRGNFKNACLVAIINIFNIVFFLAIMIWIGFNVQWHWEFSKIRDFILNNETKSIGWGVFISLLIFTIINGIFFIIVYFRIFTNSFLFVKSKIRLKLNIKVMSITNIVLIILYAIGLLITIIGFACFLYYHPGNWDASTAINAISWNFVIPLLTNLIPFIIIILCFFCLKNTTFAHK